MSSFISIGFVFNNNEHIKLLFSKLLEILKVNGEFEKISYCKDKNGDNWYEEIIKGYSIYEITSLMIDNFFAKTKMTAAIFSNKKINFDLSVTKLSYKDYGFLIEIDMDQLFKVENRGELEKYSLMIIDFCEAIFDKIKYRYSFCDHEVGIEYTWDEFKEFDENIYSISIIPQNAEFKVSLASWEIDGLTNRL